MRERIEKGERVDLFTWADVGHARKLVEGGYASIMTLFVRNTICVLSRPGFGATTETLLDKLLARPGAAAALQARAVVLDSPPGSPAPKSGDTDADAVLDGRVDASVVYCSGRDRYARLLPDATLVSLPPDFRIGPQYGLAVMKGARPEAALFALTILSRFRPVALPNDQ